MDFIVAFLVLVCLLPILLFVALILGLANKGNPFFLQQRPGKHGRLFKIIKFKTMTNQRDAQGKLLPDKDRLTLVGRIIRKTSLDEIPQLLNVIIGDMSLVGPRPLLPEYLELYSDYQKQRHVVKPGMTGWAQVNGRNAISWARKLELDVWYVKNLSFSLDMKIIWRTFFKVLSSDGVSQQRMATVEPFNGNN